MKRKTVHPVKYKQDDDFLLNIALLVLYPLVFTGRFTRWCLTLLWKLLKWWVGLNWWFFAKESAIDKTLSYTGLGGHPPTIGDTIEKFLNPFCVQLKKFCPKNGKTKDLILGVLTLGITGMIWAAWHS